MEFRGAEVCIWDFMWNHSASPTQSQR